MYFFDTETCGFHGPAVLIQYAIDDGPIVLHEVFCEPIIDTLALIEDMANHPGGVCGFNLTFDWFHIQRLYNVLDKLASIVGMDAEPRDHIDLMGEIEAECRDGKCVKPVTALDLMLFARKGPYQSTMDRKEIKIRRVPIQLGHVLANELERRIPLNDIFFARAKDKKRWRVHPIKDSLGNVDKDFVDIYLKFQPSSALKALVVDAGLREADSRLLFSDLDQLPKPLEVAWAPFATALGASKENEWFHKLDKKKGRAWPGVVHKHIEYWRFDDRAQQYARDDVVDTRALYQHFGCPQAGDKDSVLACSVGSIRWKGFRLDLEYLKELRREARIKATQAPRKPSGVYQWVTEVMSKDELVAFTDEDGKISTKKKNLEALSERTKDCSCVQSTYKTVKSEETSADFGETVYKRVIVRKVDEACPDCKGKGTVRHPAAERARACLEARQNTYKDNLYTKLIRAGRLHPSASVIGSLSGRMAGRTEVSDGRKDSSINALGIPKDKKIRRAFLLAWADMVLSGGDFEGYEVTIAEASYDDPELRKQLLTCSQCEYVCTLDEYYSSNDCPKCGGKDSRRKIHGLYAMALNPGLTYDQILATKGFANGAERDLYDEGKRGIFSQFYGGNEATLVNRGLAKDEETAKEANISFANRFKGVGRAKERCYENHCSMRQPGGIGSKVEWHDPADAVVSLNGFKRFFTLENSITKALFHLAENVPKPWQQLKIKVRRRDREQKIANAVMSALFAAAFQIQALCMRAALNHEIQSTGAEETKELQAELWALQPPGINKWMVMPLNIHDEVMAPCVESLVETIHNVVINFVKRRRSLIPLLKMEWMPRMKTWADK